MPIKLEHLKQPTHDDWKDIEKIYSETGLKNISSSEDWHQWITPARWIMAGRFNDRIIGVILAERTDNAQIKLITAGVRTITQKRGVMHQMIHFVQNWANENQLNLIVLKHQCDLAQALLNRGFIDKGDELSLRHSDD